MEFMASLHNIWPPTVRCQMKEMPTECSTHMQIRTVMLTAHFWYCTELPSDSHHLNYRLRISSEINKNRFTVTFVRTNYYERELVHPLSKTFTLT